MDEAPANDNRNGVRKEGTRKWWVLALWLALTFAVSLAGSAVTLPKIPVWYAALAKPSFTPPDWLFGPVWTILYILMAVAVWRVGGAVSSSARHLATLLFCVQLAFNAIWSPVFFGLEAPLAGLYVIVALDIFVGATLIAFWRLDRLAGIMFVPYLAWVCYATALNAAIVMRN
jgi:benzodiazapine receptor